MDAQSFKNWGSGGKGGGPRHVAPDDVDPCGNSRTKLSKELFLQMLFLKVSPGTLLTS